MEMEMGHSVINIHQPGVNGPSWLTKTFHPGSSEAFFARKIPSQPLGR